MEHSQVVFGFFGPPNEQVPKAVEPAVGAFHDPTSGFLTGFFGLSFLASGPNAGRVAERGERFAHEFGVVVRVQIQALLATGGPMDVPSGFDGGRQACQGAV